MKVVMTVKITVDVDDPDGYPVEYNAIQEYAHIKGDVKSKRERHVLTAATSAVNTAKEEIFTLLEELDLGVEMLNGQVG